MVCGVWGAGGQGQISGRQTERFGIRMERYILGNKISLCSDISKCRILKKYIVDLSE